MTPLKQLLASARPKLSLDFLEPFGLNKGELEVTSCSSRSCGQLPLPPKVMTGGELATMVERLVPKLNNMAGAAR